MFRNLTLITLLSLSLLACQHSPRKHYFVLSTAPSESVKSTATEKNRLVGIGPIVVADYLDRLPIVYSENDSTLTVLDNDYWAEPLDKGATRVIGLNLMQLNQNRSIVDFPWRGDNKPSHSVRVNIHSLTRTKNQASINASWELVDNTNKTILQRKPLAIHLV